ncbi:hypothetical protein O9993_19260 [Vibrio lentus]|nr:hypothetical protein [Vibrio lentus]
MVELIPSVCLFCVANTNAKVQVFNMPNMGLDWILSSAAIPEYDKESGAG